MSDASPSPTSPAGAPPEPRRSARDAALQLFNLRMIAAAFYFCLAMAGARSLTWLTHDDGVGDWLMEWLRFTRQTLLTALSVLAALARAEHGTLSYRLRQSAEVPGFVDDDIVIVGRAGRLSYRFPTTPGTGWTPFSVTLTAGPGWRWNWNTPATQEHIRSVLADPISLEIRGEYFTGPDEGAVDSVVLTAAQ